MQYRKFGKIDWRVSALSLGTESLSNLDRDKAAGVIRAAIDSGVNLIDIGWPLAVKAGEAFRETFAKALADGYRDKVKIMAAVPAAKINASRDFEAALDILLKWLNADSVDFLTLDGLNRFTWLRLQTLDITGELQNIAKAGRAGHLGFFFHDQFQFLREIIQAWDNWTFCQFHYSFMDTDHHPGYGGLKYAADNGLAVVATKPLLGGRLAKNIPVPVAKVWADAKPQRPPAEWALRWIFNHAEIDTISCDMDSAAQAKENAALAEAALPDSFGVPEELVINKARDAYFSIKPIPCTACRGCMPSGGLCPNGIDVPRVFEIYNDAAMYNDAETGQAIYRLERHDLDACTECGTCVCGKEIPIPEWLKKAKALLAE